MRNSRISAFAIAGAAIALLSTAVATNVSAREFNGERSWNGAGRGDYNSGAPRRGGDKPVIVDRDRGGHRDGGWHDDRGHDHGHGYGNHHGRGGYKPWWRHSHRGDDRFDGPHWRKRPWWNR